MDLDRRPSRLEMEVQRLMKQRLGGQRLSGTLDMFCPELVCGSSAWNWVMFHEERVYSPRPSSSRTLVALSTLPLSTSQTKAEWYANLMPMGNAYAPLTLPLLIMSEKQTRKYTLGSAWGFGSTRNVFEQMSLTSTTEVHEMRTIQYEWEGRVGALATNKHSEAMITFSNMSELNGRATMHQYGWIDPESGMCFITMNLVAIKSCGNCIQSHEVFCTCDDEEIVDLFEKMYIDRQQLGTTSKSLSSYGSGYVNSWLDGVATVIPVFPCNGAALTLEVRSLLEDGAAFTSCLRASLQVLTEKVQPPRISQRFVQMLQQAEDGAIADWSSVIRNTSDSEKGSSSIPSLTEEEKYGYLLNTGRTAPGLKTSSSESRRDGLASSSTESEKIVRARKETDHTCQICGKQFSHRGHLNVHVRLTHEDRREFSCEICGKKFGLNSRLTRHIRNVHDNIRRFNCNICGKTFKDAFFRNKHFLRKHNTEGLVEDDSNALDAQLHFEAY